MKLNDLNNFISTGLLSKEFKANLKDEVSSYREAVIKKKSTKPVVGIPIHDEGVLKKYVLISLLNTYLTGKIKEWELEYILSFLELSYTDFEDDIDEILFCFSDPYLGFPICLKNVKEALLFLEGKKDEFELPPVLEKDARVNYSSIFS